MSSTYSPINIVIGLYITDHMWYSPITILDPTTHFHWPMSSTYSPITILYPTIHLRNTHHWPHVQYVHSPITILIPPSTYGTHITDHMSSTYSPITILYPTIHLRNTHHWPHVQYVQSYHYIISHHPLTKHTWWDHWPHVQWVVGTVVWTCGHETHITDHMSSTYRIY